jgi:hypothetical protein
MVANICAILPASAREGHNALGINKRKMTIVKRLDRNGS